MSRPVRRSPRLGSLFLLLLVGVLAGSAVLGRQSHAVAVVASTPTSVPTDSAATSTSPMSVPTIAVVTQSLRPALPSPTAVPDDTNCAVRCLIRAAPDAVGLSLWRSAATTYRVADPTVTAQLRVGRTPFVVVQSNSTTDALYVLGAVRPDQDALVRRFGVVRDTVADVRLLAATKLPLQAAELTAAGIRVEKLPPACAAPSRGAQPFALAETLREIIAIGTSEATPLGDRQYDGPGTVLAAEYLFCRFAALGYATRYDSFADLNGRQQQNVEALPPGKERNEAMTLIVGHYDTISPYKQSAPGADDNGSGLAAMLALASRPQASDFTQRIGFVAFAAEEPGLLGSRDYTAKLLSAGTKLRAVINFDAIGLPAEGRIYINGNQASRGVYQQLVGASTDAYTLLWITDPNYLSDDEYFRRRGFIAVMITTHPFHTTPIHHTEQDRFENLDLKQINDITDLVWKWIATR